MGVTKTQTQQSMQASSRRQQGDGLEMSVKESTPSGTMTKMSNREVKAEFPPLETNLTVDILDWIILRCEGLVCT